MINSRDGKLEIVDNFRKTMFLKASTGVIYNALTNGIPKWWTEMFEGDADQPGAIFTIQFGINVFKTMVVEELVPDTRVVWLVTDSVIDIPELNDKSEWVNTRIVWEISSQQNKTELQLIHLGLTPDIECYTICETGWHNFTTSLAAFVETGIGNPFKG